MIRVVETGWGSRHGGPVHYRGGRQTAGRGLVSRWGWQEGLLHKGRTGLHRNKWSRLCLFGLVVKTWYAG